MIIEIFIIIARVVAFIHAIECVILERVENWLESAHVDT